MPFLKNTTSVPLFFVILQCFLMLHVSFLSVSVLFGNVVYSFIRRHSDDNCLATKGAEATTRTMATTTATTRTMATTTTTAESIGLDEQNNNFACTSPALFCTVSSQKDLNTDKATIFFFFFL